MSNSKKYKCIIFDYYGTLFNPAKDIFSLFENNKSSLDNDLFYKGIPDLIKYVSRCADCAIATRSPYSSVKNQLENSGLWEFFTSVKSSEFSRDKPDPVMLEDIMLELDIQPADCVMIGDSISDLAFAKNAGVDSIFVDFSNINLDLNSDHKLDLKLEFEVKKYTNAPVFYKVSLLKSYLDNYLEKFL